MPIVEILYKVTDLDQDQIFEVQQDEEHIDFINVAVKSVTEGYLYDLVITKETASALADVLKGFK